MMSSVLIHASGLGRKLLLKFMKESEPPIGSSTDLEASMHCCLPVLLPSTVSKRSHNEHSGNFAVV